MVSTAKPQNSAIDLMKFLCALLVVGIHTEPFSFSSILDNAFGIATRIAVPFFFIASSYFFFMKPFGFKQLGRFVKRIFILYAIWFIIYICFDWLYLSTPVNNQTFFDFFIYGFQHFWYLQATIIAICLYVGLLHLSKSTRIVYAIVCLLYFWGTLNSTYSHLLPFEDPLIRVIGARNGIYYAPVFIMIGHLFAQSDQPIPVRKSAVITAALFCVLAAESGLGVLVFKAQSTILWFSTPVLMYMLFSVILGIRISIPNHLSLLLRKLSIGIYCVHPIWISILLPTLGYGVLLFSAVLLLSMVASLILCYSSANIRILKHLL